MSTVDSIGTSQTFHIGTRRSILALKQADEVVALLKAAWPSYTFEIHAMATAGDKDQTTALHKFNEKSLWTQDLEVLLESGELNLIVHSLKDMPTQLPVDMVLGAVTERHDPRDALVVKPGLGYSKLSDLPDGCVVGTSSLRRTAQLKRYFPNLKFADVRGNIGTRLSKLDNPESEYSAIILAVAGLARLGLTSRITSYLSKENGGMLHAVGQGGLGIEIKQGDTRLEELLRPIIHEPSFRATLAERSLMRTLEGGCSVPIGVETRWVSQAASLTGSNNAGVMPADQYDKLSGIAIDEQSSSDELEMQAIVVSLDGQQVAAAESRRKITSREDADEFGWHVAKLLVQNGADKILQQINLDRGIIAAQGNA